jgi:arylsulfatase A-like enzyme
VKTPRRESALRIQFLVALVAAGCAESEAPSPPASRPSVVLISIDTLRADHVHCLGYHRETTPVIDRLAAEGALFTQHVSNTSWTLPSHASMLSGLPETVHGVEDDDRVIDPARTLLAEVFQAAGYRTGGVFSGPYLHPTFGFGQGFEVYENAVVAKPPPGQADWETLNDTDRMRIINRYTYQVSTGPEVVARALGWLDSLRDDEPFFLFVHLFDCHWDYMPPERYWRRFDPDFDDAGFDGRRFAANPQIAPDMPKRRLEHLIARYDGEILFTDEMVGRLVDHLDLRDRLDETLIVVTSDHGEEFFEHGQKGHRNNLFDESLRVPLVVRLPGAVPAGARIDDQTSIVDVAPTILSLCGVPAPREMRGRDLTPLVTGGGGRHVAGDSLAAGRLAVPGGPYQRFLRSARSKLITAKPNRDASSELETLLFFDLADDPRELRPRLAPRSSGALPERLVEALRGLDARERLERDFATTLERAASLAAPRIDDELRRQLIENGYLGGG